MITIGSATNNTEPNTDVSHGPRNGLRQRAIRWTNRGLAIPRLSRRSAPGAGIVTVW
ncbi:hypothetical protein MAGR_39650 [Mycolicibacterium agri]|uniref:Uncharacterized protein n=1 Tax=Mycolicibacterium agri TaxID=36811 RepID=A0A7I9W493_MYCAG|nr:hypothetical protein MAGR_39650 [Mycolicibacterium agri]